MNGTTGWQHDKEHGHMTQQIGFTVDRKSLSGALAHAARVTERRNTIPILSNVLLRFERDKLELVATDLDLELMAQLPAATDGEGVLTVALAAFADAVKKLKGESVRIVDMGDKRISVTCAESGTSLRLPTLPADNFPRIAAGDMLAEFDMATDEFASAMGLAAAFVSTEESRYYLKGVFLHTDCDNPGERTEEHETLAAELAALRAVEQGALDVAGPPEGREPDAQAQLETVRERVAARSAEISARIDVLESDRMRPDVLRFASTDGHRMARITRTLPKGGANQPPVIVPTKACKAIAAIIGKKPDGPGVYIRVNATKIEFTYGRFRLLAKVIDGTFPDYTRVIPTMNGHRLTVPAGTFAGAVEAVTAICKERTRAITIAMNSDDPGAAILSATSAENGTAAQVFEGASYAQPEGFGAAERVIGFNASYLAQFLKVFAGDVTIALADESGPVLITAPDQPGTTLVLMPMRVGSGITTRAAVEALTMSPWESFCHKAKHYAVTLANLTPEPDMRKPVLQSIGGKMREAVDYLAANGEPRHLARLTVKMEIGFAEGTREGDIEGERARRLKAAYGGTQIGADGLSALATVVEGERDPVQDPEPDMDPALAPETPESEWVTNPNYPDAPENDPMRPAEPETVAAEGPVSPVVATILADPPAEEPRQPVKVETVYGQVIFVDAGDYADETKARIRRLHKSGSPFVERESRGGSWQRVLRENIRRAILPRNKPDQPHAAVKAQPIDSTAARLAALERVVAGLTGQPVEAPPKRSAAHVRAIMAYLQLRETRERARINEAKWLRSCESRQQADQARVEADAERDAAIDRADLLQVRCDALERLQLDSGPLDTAAPKLNGQPPAIILPVTRTSARAQ